MSQLKQRLSRFDLTMVAIGSTIGSGIFLTPSIIMNTLPSPMWVLGVWLGVGVMIICGALTYAELGAMMPGAGGIYVYLSKAYGKMFGFLYGWIYLSVVNTGSLAALSLAFATYFGYFMHLDSLGISIVAIAGLLFLTAINVLGVKVGAVFADLFTILKIAGIAGLISIGLLLGGNSGTDFSAPLGELPGGFAGALALAMVGVMWSYGGWHHTTFLAAEAKDPRRGVPFAMIVGAIAVTVIYLLVNVAYLLLLSPSEIASSSRVAADAIERVLGPIGGSLIAITIFISTFGTSGIYTMAAPRIYFAMANDRIFFSKIAQIHPKYGTPAFSIILQSLWAVVLILFWGTFENVISYVVFTDSIFFALTAAAVFVLRRKQPEAERAYKTLGYPITPLIFIAVEIWFVFNAVFQKPAESIVGIAFVLLGIPLYYYWKRKSETTGMEKQTV